MSAAPVPILAGFALLVPESPMWLYSKKRVKEAEKVLRQFAQLNGKDPSTITLSGHLVLPEKESDQAAAFLKPSSDSKTAKVNIGLNSTEDKVSMQDLFRTFPAFMLSFGQIFSWFATSIIFYGFLFGVEGISGDVYINSILLALCEFPVWLVVFAMDKFGRKKTFYVCLIISSLACLVLPFTKPLADGNFQIAFAIVGKSMARAALSLLFTYTAELFPTVLRGSGLLICAAASKEAVVIAPFVFKMDYGLHNCTPFVLFAVLGFISSFLIILYSHETLGAPFLNTREEFFAAVAKRKKDKEKISNFDEVARNLM